MLALAFEKLCLLRKSLIDRKLAGTSEVHTGWHFSCLGIRYLKKFPEARWVMMHRMMVSAIIAGVLVGYSTLLYALVRTIVLINQSYVLSLAM